ncbi:MAG: cyclic nucleotide-binding domain-containing protein [Alphaproteobacteria bacterium]|nr:cyclic nucleotide-binding domain-containing protein [Alphaproteobacteria bacterium]
MPAPVSRWAPLRQRLYLIVEIGRHGDLAARVFEVAMSALILANIGAYVLETVPAYAATWGEAFAFFDLVSLWIFLIEYLVRLWVSIEHPPVRRQGPILGRLAFAARPDMLIDLVVISPLVLGMFGFLDTRFLRILRILRFLKLARFSPALATLGRVIRSEARALFGTAIIMLGAAIVSASLLQIIEGRVQPEAFGTVPHAMWWAITTLTTVGYGDVVPVTALGRMIGALTMIIGLGLFALPVGIISNGYINEIRKRDFVVTWGMVARVPLFASLDAAAIAEITQILRSRTARAGEVIAEGGTAADGMYFITSGEVELALQHSTITLGDGDFFGELSLFGAMRRGGTATAVTQSDLLELEAADFEALMKRRPLLKQRIAAAIAAHAAALGLDQAEGDVLPAERVRHPKTGETFSAK